MIDTEPVKPKAAPINSLIFGVCWTLLYSNKWFLWSFIVSADTKVLGSRRKRHFQLFMAVNTSCQSYGISWRFVSAVTHLGVSCCCCNLSLLSLYQRETNVSLGRRSMSIRHKHVRETQSFWLKLVSLMTALCSYLRQPIPFHVVETQKHKVLAEHSSSPLWTMVKKGNRTHRWEETNLSL